MNYTKVALLRLKICTTDTNEIDKESGKLSHCKPDCDNSTRKPN